MGPRPTAVRARRAWACAALAVGALWLAGCAVTAETRQSLAAYTQAMGQALLGAELFLDDFASGLKAQGELARGAAGEAPSAAPEYPDAFVPPGVAGTAQTDAEKSVDRTRLALAVIRQYNAALVALAEGQSEQDVRSRTLELGGALESLGAIAGVAIPGLAPFVAIGPRIIKLAQDAANRKQLEQAVEQGREPVGVILQALEDQTPAIYKLSVVGTKQAQTRVQNYIRRTAETLKSQVARHAAPADAELARKAAALQADLGEIGRRTKTREAMPIPLPYGAGKPALDAMAYAETEVFVQAMRASASAYAELVARQNAYHELMNRYVAMLRQTRRSLDLVAASLARPVDLGAEVGRLLRTVFELRDALAAVRHPAAAAAP